MQTERATCVKFSQPHMSNNAMRLPQGTQAQGTNHFGYCVTSEEKDLSKGSSKLLRAVYTHAFLVGAGGDFCGGFMRNVKSPM